MHMCSVVICMLVVVMLYSKHMSVVFRPLVRVFCRVCKLLFFFFLFSSA